MKPRAKKPSTADESTASCQSAEFHPYEVLLVEQKKRDEEWAANCEASKVKKTTLDDISALKQQLEAKDCECTLLRNQLRGQESLCKVNTKISNLINM